MDEEKEMMIEDAMTELEEIVRSLESGTTDLEGALKLYEKGIELVRICTQKLDNAEQVVKMLQFRPDGKAALVDFESGEVTE